MAPTVKTRAWPYWDALQRAFGLQGRVGDVIGLETSPEVILADLTLPEYRWLSRTMQFGSGGLAGAVAGQVSQFAVENPAASGVLCVIQRLVLVNNAGAVANLGWGDGAVPVLAGVGVIGAYNVDGRQLITGIGGQSQCNFRGGSNAATPYVARVQIGGNVATEIPCPIILPPGKTFLFGGVAVNQSMSAYGAWTERPFDPQELA